MDLENLPVIRFHIEKGMVKNLTVSLASELEPHDQTILKKELEISLKYLTNGKYSSLLSPLNELISHRIIPFESQLLYHFELEYLRVFGLDIAHQIVEETAKAGFFSTTGPSGGCTLEELTESKELNKHKQMNSVLINAMPRSASTFISNLIRLDYEGPTRFFKVGISEFPSTLLIPSKVQFLNDGGVFCKDHFMPTPRNIDVLRRSGFSKIFIMLRDPRQALLSWAHECHNQFCNDFSPNYELDYMYLENFCKADLSERINLLIDKYYPELVSFADQWTRLSECKEEAGISIKIAEFASVKEDSLRYVENIVIFFNLPMGVVNKFRGVHKIKFQQGKMQIFRRGETNEWRQVFTPDQIARTTEKIPDYLIQKYGWLDINNPMDIPPP